MDRHDFRNRLQELHDHLIRQGMLSRLYSDFLTVGDNVSVVLSPMYEVPVLHFTHFAGPIKGIVTPGIHPITQLPSYYAHPCTTRQLLRDFDGNLITWWHFFSDRLGLQLEALTSRTIATTATDQATEEVLEDLDLQIFA